MLSKYQSAALVAKWLAIAAIAVHAPYASAQPMVEVPMLGAVQLGLNGKGEVNRCGLELLGGSVAGTTRRIFDVSLYADASGRGLGKLTIKAGEINVPPEKLTSEEVHGGWIRAQGTAAAMPIGALIEGETPDSKLYVTEFTPALITLFSIVADAQPAQVAIESKPGLATVYFGKPAIEAAHRAQFIQCMEDLEKTMSSEADRMRDSAK